MDAASATSIKRADLAGGRNDEAGVRVSLITLGGEQFAIDLRYVREVFEVESSTPVPGMPGALIGVANLRGVVIPLLDVRAMLGLASTGTLPPFAVVLKHGLHQVAVLVERVPEVRSLPRAQVLPMVANAESKARPFVSALLRLEEGLGGMLDVPLIFSQLEGGTA